jgi:hypothetical protein
MRSALVVAGPKVAMIFTRLRRGASAMGNQRSPSRSAIVAPASRVGRAGRFTFWPS